MASVALLGTATFNTSTGTKTVVATPAVGDLIVIVTAHTGNTSTATPTDNNPGGTGAYTTIVNSKKATNADTMMIHIRTALITNAGSTTFTHAPGSSSGGGLAVFAVKGMTKVGAAAARSNGKQENQAASGTPAPVLSNTPLVTNAIISAVFNSTTPAVVQRTGYTEPVDATYNTPTTGLEVMIRDYDETTATLTYGGTSATAFCSAAIELDVGNPPGPDYPSRVLGESSLQSYWRMNEPTGTAMVDYKGTVTGTYENSPTLDQAGAVPGGRSVRLTGAAVHSRLGDVFDFLGNQAYSIEFWANVDTVDSGYRPIISKVNSGIAGWWMGYTTDANNGFFIKREPGNKFHGSSTYTILTGVWYHVVGTYDGSALRLYINGLIRGTSTAATETDVDSAIDAIVGGFGSGTGFLGYLAEVAIYNAALSATQVMDHYVNRYAADQPDLINRPRGIRGVNQLRQVIAQ